MLRSLFCVFAFTTATAEYGCSSFTQLTHTASGCPANQGNPDCSFIQANAQQFCSTAATSWEIINGPNCNLRGASYGCIFASGLYSTTDQFCCPLIVIGAVPTATASVTASVTASISSASASATTWPTFSVTASPQPTRTAAASLTSQPTQTATSTGTFTAIPSTNITIVYIQTTDSSIQKGYAAAIGLSAVFGFVVLCVCCGIAIRRRPAKPDEIIRQVTLVERRKSIAEEGKERRKSTLEIRTVTDTKN